MKVKLLAALSFLVGICIFDANAEGGRFQHPGIGLNRCAWDSQTAYYITGGRPHWDSQFRWPLPKPGEYTIRYRCDGQSGIGIINPEDNPPKRNLVKLDFRTKGKHLDLEWIKVP